MMEASLLGWSEGAGIVDVDALDTFATPKVVDYFLSEVRGNLSDDAAETDDPFATGKLKWRKNG